MEVGGEGDYIPIATLPMSAARPFLSLESLKLGTVRVMPKTFGKGWVGRGCLYLTGLSVLWQFLACESLQAYSVCIWRCEHASFCMEVVFMLST